MILRRSIRMPLARESHPARADHEPLQNDPLGDNWHTLACSLRLLDLAIMATGQNCEVIWHFAGSNARDGNVRYTSSMSFRRVSTGWRKTGDGDS